ncbi:MAG TPA: DUF1918 domain-containing protein [Actinomycetota bacterium]
MGKAGDRIVVESESVGTPTREGEVLEIIEGSVSVRYRVRWSDGHESIFSPSVGSATIFPAKAARATSKTKATTRSSITTKAKTTKATTTKATTTKAKTSRSRAKSSRGRS